MQHHPVSPSCNCASCKIERLLAKQRHEERERWRSVRRALNWPDLPRS